MNTLLDSFSATAALVSGLAMGHADPAAAALDHSPAMAALRSAQIELYCDHDQAALDALTNVREALLHERIPASEALAAVDAALWHLRRHASSEAQEAIAQARQRLA